MMERGTSDQPTTFSVDATTELGPLGRGFWVGAIFAAGAVASWPIIWAVAYVLDSACSSFSRARLASRLATRIAKEPAGRSARRDPALASFAFPRARGRH